MMVTFLWHIQWFTVLACTAFCVRLSHTLFKPLCHSTLKMSNSLLQCTLPISVHTLFCICNCRSNFMVFTIQIDVEITASKNSTALIPWYYNVIMLTVFLPSWISIFGMFLFTVFHHVVCGVVRSKVACRQFSADAAILTSTSKSLVC